MREIADQGFASTEGVLAVEEVNRILCVLKGMETNGRRRGGLRNLLELGALRKLAQSKDLLDLVEPVLGRGSKVVRGILFDKTNTANWKVPWHQDVTIAVRSKVQAVGYGPWSVKEGVLHVQPPREVLEKMLSIRIHLDDCPKENGALRVLPGSHLDGKLTANEIDHWVSTNAELTCELCRGGALLMRPLLLHASSASAVPGHRRIVHLDYAAVELAPGMDWAEIRTFV